MKVLQINTAVNTGSTGRIAERIGLILLANAEQSIIAYGRGSQKSASQTIKIGSRLDYQLHGLKTRLLDKHAFGSKHATQKLINKIESLNPDVIHLHNLHGYYIHVGVLFNYLKKANKPILWTLHDCWSFTGHCSYFSFVKCDKWKIQCHHCPLCRRYPESLFIDNSFSNYNLKKELFTGLENMVLITPSYWLRDLLKDSFLKTYPVQVIHNGIDLKKFIPAVKQNETYRKKIGAANRNIILGIASIWDRRKGLNDFVQLAAILNDTEVIVLVGLTEEVIKTLPVNIIGIPRTESMDELVALYNMATVFMNPTWVDNFPTTNIEALATGTPVITYRTGGSIEAIDESTGLVVEQGDIEGLKIAVEKIKAVGKNKYAMACRQRAEAHFNETERFTEYYQLYKTMLSKEEMKMMKAQ
jgi:putative colanic acid biosynthesis glycosyltransferase